MKHIFITGFPGFLGSAMVEKLLDQYGGDVILHCLVQPKYTNAAAIRKAYIEAKSAEWKDRIQLIEGDITQADLGGNISESIKQDISQVYHFAAVYRVGVSRKTAMAVNAQGTRHILQFCKECDHFEQLHYMSTIFVSGKYEGMFSEFNLECGQEFNNYYEESKFRAELAVQEAMQSGLSATIYRPSIVVGDSTTGKTLKTDGLYYLINLIRKQSKIAILPGFDKPEHHYLNVVPRDYTVDAIFELSRQKNSMNQVYHLCDPEPINNSALIDLIANYYGKKTVLAPAQSKVLHNGLKKIPFFNKALKFDAEVLEYFSHPTTYSCDNTLRDLHDAQLECPALPDYLEVLIQYLEQNPELSPAAMA